MSLDTWLLPKTKSEKPETKEQSEDDSWNPSLINKVPERKIVGILGGHKRSDFHEFKKTVINDFIVKLGSQPDLVLLNDEGKDTSGMIWMWCESNSIPCRYIKADWSAGKSAAIRRDTQILKEANAFIIFQQPRSDKYAKTAKNLEKKKKTVLFVEGISPV